MFFYKIKDEEKGKKEEIFILKKKFFYGMGKEIINILCRKCLGREKVKVIFFVVEFFCIFRLFFLNDLLMIGVKY